MLNEIALALLQAATEFLPISSSGHLALVSNIISEPNLFFITTLHLASLLAVLIFTRKEISLLLRFDKQANKLWVYLIIATIPAALVGFFFKEIIEKAFFSYLFIGIAFLFTGIILFLTKFAGKFSKLNSKNAFVIGLFQASALFPGISRSGMTISSAALLGIDKEKAAKFSFLLFIPLAIGASILELEEAYFSTPLIIAFFITLLASLFFLDLLMKIIIKEKFWLFSFYCFAIGIISLGLYFLV